ncbi:MAG: hypothetical protein E7084_06725 [Bacteroidales bacterium]|nr:hypothetical protein [Bacteroidales bacterium]
MDKDKMQCPEIEKACNDETITRNNAPICQPTAESYRLNEIVQYLSRVYNCNFSAFYNSGKVAIEASAETSEKKRAQPIQSTATQYETMRQSMIERLNDLCSKELNKLINSQENR